VLLVDLKLL